MYGLHTRTVVARLPLRQLGFLVSAKQKLISVLPRYPRFACLTVIYPLRQTLLQSIMCHLLYVCNANSTLHYTSVNLIERASRLARQVGKCNTLAWDQSTGRRPYKTAYLMMMMMMITVRHESHDTGCKQTLEAVVLLMCKLSTTSVCRPIIHYR